MIPLSFLGLERETQTRDSTDTTEFCMVAMVTTPILDESEERNDTRWSKKIARSFVSQCGIGLFQ